MISAILNTQELINSRRFGADMNEILKAIPVLFNQRNPVTMPDRVDLTALTINKTNRQFERAFIEVTGYGQKQERSNHTQ